MRFDKRRTLGVSVAFLAAIVPGAVAAWAQTAAPDVVEVRAAPTQPDAVPNAWLDAATADNVRAYGVTAAEGRRRAELGLVASRLQAQLEANAAGNFAGLTIENGPEFRILVRFRSDPTASLAPFLSSIDLGGTAEAVAAPASFSELRAARSSLEAALTAAGVEYMTTIDSDRGGVDVYVRDRAAFDTAIAQRRLSLPARTNVLEAPYLVQTEAVFVGGEPTPSTTGAICTLGYAVFFTADNTRGYTTAGHCENARLYAGVTLTLKSQLDTGARDLQWHVAQSGTHTYSPSIDLQNGTYRYVYYYMPLASMVDGNAVCMVGDSSGYRCGTIYRHDVVWRGQCCMVWVKPPSGDLSLVGDSGGPWFYSNTAYGSHVGNPAGFANDAIFMPISYLPDWGLALLAATPP